MRALLLALGLLSACAINNGTGNRMDERGFVSSRDNYRVRDAATDSPVYEGTWRVANFTKTQPGSMAMSSGWADYTLYTTSDTTGRVDLSLPRRDLVLESTKDDGRIWFVSVPLTERDQMKDQRMSLWIVVPPKTIESHDIRAALFIGAVNTPDRFDATLTAAKRLVQRVEPLP